MQVKNDSAKGSIPYESAKLFMNSFVGKLAERRRPNSLIKLERMGQEQGFNGVAQLVAKSSEFRDSLRGLLEVGRVFIPEWACLILGRARAVMAELVQKGAKVVSTDSILVPAETDISCASLEALRLVESDMPIVLEADAIIVFRTRLYALLQRTERLRLPPGQSPLAQEGPWALVKLAGQGVPVDRNECALTIVESIAAQRLVKTPRTKTRLLSAESAIREGKALNAEVKVSRPPKFSLETKRKIVNRDLNPWREFSETVPYESIGRLKGVENQRATKRCRSHQEKRKQAWQAREKVLLLLAERSHSLSEIARMTNVPKATIAGLKKRMPWPQMDNFLSGQKLAPPSKDDETEDE
jgi:hypothetical protein